MELDLRLGELAEIRIDRKIHKSKVQDVIDSSNFVLDCPLENNTLLLVHPGDEMDIVFFRKDSSNNVSSYKFKAEVLNRRTLKDNIRHPVIDFKRISEIEKIQRRNFFRLDYNTIAEARALDDNNRASEKIIKLRVVDISAGGMKAISKERLYAGDYIQLDFKIEGYGVSTYANIIKCDYLSDSKEYDARINFMNLPTDVEDDIIKIMTKLQSERLLIMSNKEYDQRRENEAFKDEAIEDYIQKQQAESGVNALKALSLILSFLAFVMYLFTFPKSQYPMDNLFKNVFGMEQRVASDVSDYITYTIAVSILNFIIAAYGQFRQNHISKTKNPVFMTSILISIILFVLSIIKSFAS